MKGHRVVQRTSGRVSRRDAAAAAGFLLPFLGLLLIFQYVPLAFLARDSMYDFTLLNPDARKFVGFDNFVRVFTDPTILGSFLVTLIFMAGLVLLVVPLGFFVALYMDSKMKGRTVIRTMIFLPVVTSAVVVATMWTFMLNQSGLINSLLSSFGLGPFSFLTEKSQALPAIIIMTVWQQLGLASVLFLGGLQSIPETFYDAARIDGARGLQIVRYITLPLVSRTTVLVVVVMTVFAVQSFAPAYIMTGGSPEGSTNFIMYHIFILAFTLQSPGIASAISLVVLVFALIISLIQMRLFKTKWDY